MAKKRLFTIAILAAILLITVTISAQSQFAATLEVLNTGVEVQRVNTGNFIAIEVEAIVGVGDTIRTNETGRARITFFANGTDVVLEPNTEYSITQFEGNDEDFNLTVEVLAGQTTHRLNRVLGANSSYDVDTPTMTLAARGTVFRIRVEDSGRAGMIVTEGTVDADADDNTAEVPAEFGIRAATDGGLSDVVKASSFAELDSAIDGCNVTVTTPDDVSINVRVGPSTEQTQIGIITASEIDTFYGIKEDGAWYRIAFEDGYGWILSSTANVHGGCAGLRVFDRNHTEDDSLVQQAEETTTDEDAAGD